MKPRFWSKLSAMALAAALVLAGCAGPQEPETDPVQPLRNDGRAAVIVLGEVQETRARTDVLLEIAEKYMADYPNTQVKVATYATPQALKAAVLAGDVQIADLSDQELPEYLREGLLADLAEDLPRWSEYATLLTPAKWVSHATDSLHSYLVPSDVTQDVLIYRQDWMDAYNEGKESSEMIYCRVWEQLIKAADALGENGKLVFAGQDRLTNHFDAMLWSMLTTGRLLDTGYGYYYPRQEGRELATVFSHEKAQEGIDQFARVMRQAVLPEALTATREEALQAFIDGRACFLLADRSAFPALEAAMPEGTWASREYPLGLAGYGVTTPVSYRGWGVSAAAAEPEIALHFLTFLSNADNNTHYAVTCGTYPLHSTGLLLEPDLVTGEFAPEVTMARKPNLYRCAQEPTLYEAWETYRAQAPEKLIAFVRGSLSQEELTAWLDDYWLEAARTEGYRWESGT